MTDFIIILLPSIFVAFVTAYFSAKFYSYKAKADLQKELEGRFNERKWETYTKFSNTLRKIKDDIKNNKLNKNLNKYVREMNDFSSSLWLIGSDDVVNAFNDWQSSNKKVEDESITGKVVTNEGKDALTKLMIILIEMRKDLGYNSTKISPKDLLATFVSDVDEHF